MAEEKVEKKDPMEEFTRETILMCEQLKQNIDNVLRADASDSETQGDSLSLTFKDAKTQTCTTDLKALGDCPPLSLQDVITQTDTSDFEVKGETPPMSYQDVTTQTDPPEVEVKGDSRPQGVTDCSVQTCTTALESMGDPLSLAFEDAITQTDAPDFTSSMTFQDVITQTDTSYEDVITQTDPPKDPFKEWVAQTMLRFDQLNQSLDNLFGDDASAPMGITYRSEEMQSDYLLTSPGNDITQPYTTDSEAQGYPSEMRISPRSDETSTFYSEMKSEYLLSSSGEAKGDSPPVSFQDAITQTDPPIDPFNEWNRQTDTSYQDVITQTDPPQDPFKEWVTQTMLRFDQLNQSLDNLFGDEASAPMRNTDRSGETSTFYSEMRSEYLLPSYGDDFTQTNTTDLEAIGGSPPSQDLISHSDTSNFEAVERSNCSVQTPSLALQDAHIQTDTTYYQMIRDSMVPIPISGAIQTPIWTPSNVRPPNVPLFRVPKTILGSKATKLPEDQQVLEEHKDLEDLQEVLNVPKESKAMELTTPQEVPKLPDLREVLDVPKKSKAMDVPVLPEVPELPEGLEMHEILDVVKEPIAMDVPEFLEALPLPSMQVQVPKNVQELHKAFDVLKEPKAMVELPEVHEVSEENEVSEEREVSLEHEEPKEPNTI